MKIFLDSGAFSVWNAKKEIDLDNYISFCKRYEKDLEVIASLDVIPGQPNKRLTPDMVEKAAKKGFENYTKMLKAKIPHEKLLHTFHQGDPKEYLERLVNIEEAYIGVSPANDRTTIQRKEWLHDDCMPIIIGEDGKPKVKFHGFAVTSLKLVFAYPWYSVDSSSWRLRGGGFGLIDIPTNPYLKEQKDYYIRSLPISKGVKKYKQSEELEGFFDIPQISQSELSFNKMPLTYKEKVKELIKEYGFTLNELETDHMKRSIWNALYLMTSIKKFTSTKLYLATSDLKSVRLLGRKLRELGLKTDNFNILISYALSSNKGNTSTLLDTLIKIKHRYE